MSSAPDPTPSNSSGSSRPGPFMTQRTAIILLTAVVIGLIVGGLTFLSDTAAPGAVLAGTLSAGGSVPVLHGLID
ncbi:hypothetical protein ACWGDT_27320 [Streptomyces avermitilis]